MLRSLVPSLVLLAVALPVPAWADNAKLAVQARKILKTHCQACHHGPGSEYGTWDVLDRDSLVKDTDEDRAVVVPGKLDASTLWRRVGKTKTMPPRAIKDRPSEAELNILRQWIEAGAPAYPKPQPRTLVTTEQLLNVLIADLRQADPRDRPYRRYFTLIEQANNPAFEVEDLRLLRAALAKVLNSLSWQSGLVVPKALDDQQTIFVVDLRDLGWEAAQWDAVLRQYPYGLDYRGSDDEKLRRLGVDLNDLVKDNLVHVRADWFVTMASQAPLYYDLLRLPMTVDELEQKLQVDFGKNFAGDRLARAGFARSGVSGQNRLVEWHPSPVGQYYWKSYDFKPRKERANLNRFPLGPAFEGNPYASQAFDHDGGEMIFGLPNGLQGYYLSDARGQRISEGPIAVVSDALKTSGSPAIVNGGSCMHCHKLGMIPFTDTVRAGHALFGEPREKVLRLYPEVKAMANRVKANEDRFVGALEKVIGPFLQVDDDKETPIREFAEPVGEVMRRYLLQDVSCEVAAFELGLAKPTELAGLIKGNQKLKELGLMPLATGQVIKRGDWEAIAGTSLFQDVARELQLGTPVRFR